MGRPIKKFVRYQLLDTLKKPQAAINDDNKSQSEFLLENKLDENIAETNIDLDEHGTFLQDDHIEPSDKMKNQPNKQIIKGTSYLESLMLFLKANIGSGVLAMPFGFKNSGLIFGTVWLSLMGFICTMCIHVLINCYKHVISNLTPNSINKRKPNDINYEEVAYLVVKEKTPLNSKYPSYAKFLVSFVSRIFGFNQTFNVESLKKVPFNSLIIFFMCWQKCF